MAARTNVYLNGGLRKLWATTIEACGSFDEGGFRNRTYARKVKPFSFHSAQTTNVRRFTREFLEVRCTEKKPFNEKTLYRVNTIRRRVTRDRRYDWLTRTCVDNKNPLFVLQKHGFKTITVSSPNGSLGRRTRTFVVLDGRVAEQVTFVISIIVYK